MCEQMLCTVIYSSEQKVTASQIWIRRMPHMPLLPRQVLVWRNSVSFATSPDMESLTVKNWDVSSRCQLLTVASPLPNDCLKPFIFNGSVSYRKGSVTSYSVMRHWWIKIVVLPLTGRTRPLRSGHWSLPGSCPVLFYQWLCWFHGKQRYSLSCPFVRLSHPDVFALSVLVRTPACKQVQDIDFSASLFVVCLSEHLLPPVGEMVNCVSKEPECLSVRHRTVDVNPPQPQIYFVFSK